MERNKKIAIKRADILWQHYHSHGQLLLADVKRLIGVPFAALYATFESNDVDAPPVWNSQGEKLRRKAEVLNAEARRRGKNFLTERQAAEALGVKLSRVSPILTQIEKHRLEVIEIRGEVQISAEPRQMAQHPFPLMRGQISYKHHPQGLPVLDWWEGPGEGEVTYRIR